MHKLENKNFPTIINSSDVMIAKQDSKSRCFLMRLLILKFGNKHLSKHGEHTHNRIQFWLLGRKKMTMFVIQKRQTPVKWECLYGMERNGTF